MKPVATQEDIELGGVQYKEKNRDNDVIPCMYTSINYQVSDIHVLNLQTLRILMHTIQIAIHQSEVVKHDQVDTRGTTSV